MQRQQKIPRDLFLFSIMTVLTVFTWLTLDAYRSWKKKDLPEVLQQQIEPLNPQLDTQVLNSLSSRIRIQK